jgi:hypothetical protein
LVFVPVLINVIVNALGVGGTGDAVGAGVTGVLTGDAVGAGVTGVLTGDAVGAGVTGVLTGDAVGAGVTGVLTGDAVGAGVTGVLTGDAVGNVGLVGGDRPQAPQVKGHIVLTRNPLLILEQYLSCLTVFLESQTQSCSAPL